MKRLNTSQRTTPHEQGTDKHSNEISRYSCNLHTNFASACRPAYPLVERLNCFAYTKRHAICAGDRRQGNMGIEPARAFRGALALEFRQKSDEQRGRQSILSLSGGCSSRINQNTARMPTSRHGKGRKGSKYYCQAEGPGMSAASTTPQSR